MKKAIVTGGCGFIGSNFIKKLLEETDMQIVNIDALTYASKGNNLDHMGLSHNPRYKEYNFDIRDAKAMETLVNEIKPDVLFHFAAESHVDKSISSAAEFITTNVQGTFNLLEAARKAQVPLFVQVSTDEVYGSLSPQDCASKETDVLKPRSPYSASKAAAEHIAMSYFHTHGLPVIVTRSSNNYGPYQFPEKIIPRFITNLIRGKKVPLMWSPENPGMNVRDWLHVDDNCRAIFHLSQYGIPGEIYNISGGNHSTNIALTRKILKEFGKDDSWIEKIPHRKGHDLVYRIDDSKLRSRGFERIHTSLEQGIHETVEWYKENMNWWGELI